MLYRLRRYLQCGLTLTLLASAVPALPAEQLKIDDAVRLALQQNPRVLAAVKDTEAARANARGAGALVNPEILVTPGIAGPAGSDEELFVSQPLEINGARRARKRIASGELKSTQAETEIVSREIVRDVKIAYWNAVLAQHLVELNRENVQVGESLYNSAKRQLEVGAAPGAQVLKAEVELSRARQELLKSESELKRAQAVLKTLTGLPPDKDIELVDKLVYAPVKIDEAELSRSTFANRPELNQTKGRIESGRGEIDAAKAARKPDVAFQGRRETFGGDGGLALGFTIPLFDWGSSKAARREAEERVAAEELRLQAIRNQIALEVQTAVSRVIEADELVKRYNEGTLSQSERLLQMAQKGYQAGAISYLEVLEAQHTFRNVRSEYYTALADHAKAKAELEWAAAVPEEVKE